MKNNNVHISVITPVYGCCENLNELYLRLSNTLATITDNFEIIMVNDASPDQSWKIIRDLTAKDKRIVGINLSKNFGQHYAITAGLDYAKGDWSVVMDCDLQDQPEEIIKLYDKAQEGYDIVYGISKFRSKNHLLSKISSYITYKLYKIFNSASISNVSFTIMNKKVVNEFRKLPEFNRTFFSILDYIGFKFTGIEVDHKDRPIGKSSYTLTKKIKLAIDLMFGNTTIVLKSSFYFGFIVSFISFVFALNIIIRKLIFDSYPEGWVSIIVLISFFSGLIIVLLGVIGFYLEKIFYETKSRPKYIIDEIINFNA